MQGKENNKTGAHYTLRHPRPEEGEVLTALAIKSKKYWGYSDNLIAAWLPELTVTKDFLENCIGYVVEQEEKIIGFWCSSAQEGSLEAYVFIDPDFIRKGIGLLLWGAVKKEAQEKGLSYLTWLSDPNSEGFYSKIGAQKIGEEASKIVKGRKLPIMRYFL